MLHKVYNRRDEYYETLNNKSRLLLSLLITMYEIFFYVIAKWCVCSVVISTSTAAKYTVTEVSRRGSERAET